MSEAPLFTLHVADAKPSWQVKNLEHMQAVVMQLLQENNISSGGQSSTADLAKLQKKYVGETSSRITACLCLPAPFTLHPTLYTLHPTPYTPHPTPYTLHPELSTLNPVP